MLFLLVVLLNLNYLPEDDELVSLMCDVSEKNGKRWKHCFMMREWGRVSGSGAMFDDLCLSVRLVAVLSVSDSLTPACLFSHSARLLSNQS